MALVLFEHNCWSVARESYPRIKEESISPSATFDPTEVCSVEKTERGEMMKGSKKRSSPTGKEPGISLCEPYSLVLRVITLQGRAVQLTKPIRFQAVMEGGEFILSNRSLQLTIPCVSLTEGLQLLSERILLLFDTPDAVRFRDRMKVYLDGGRRISST